MTHITIEKAKLEQWLEALEDLQRQYSIYPNSFWEWSKGRKAIATIKQALAAPTVHEPVAVVDENDDGYWADILPNRDVKVGQLLYPTPQQRPWVGLVNKDKVLDFENAHVTTEFARGALWAEAKLKELNQ